ncbi:MAG: 3-deoxy-7-phosphoheptulonate synthase [Deltaproteobacteria bacterium]|nr:3-deoxy-7-phosphoheptulonate synthase [Myxococcales bacterium]MDP3217177.1 3-deoxy-7-phosphoheptulonate synthase [Deltaproteobacteria bacterium]
MIIQLAPDADTDQVKRALVAAGLWVTALHDGDRRVSHFSVSSASSAVEASALLRIPGVASVVAPASAHPRVDASPPTVNVRGVEVGGAAKVFMAGPCAVESEAQIDAVAARVAASGARLLRGGAFKPRSSPYAFQGHGEVALRWMRRAAEVNGLRVVTEALGEADVSLVAEYADLVQVGSRNMQNFALLKAIGRTGRPAMLKRAMSATVEEWLLAGEYLLEHGAAGVIYCERGIRGFDHATRNLLDLGAVALLAHVHRLPVVVDPSHATGRRDLVLPLARAGLAAGAAGVMLETHDDPGRALSDGPQALLPEEFVAVMAALHAGAAEA